MGQNVLKRSLLSVVSVNENAGERSAAKTAALKRLFSAWNREVPRPNRMPLEDDLGIKRVVPGSHSRKSVSPDRQFSVRKRSQLLTTREVLGLNRATVRESEVHRSWPREAVLKFMAAEVIKRRPSKR